MSQRPTPAPHVAGVSISNKYSIPILIILLIIIALWGKSPTAPRPAPATTTPKPPVQPDSTGSPANSVSPAKGPNSAPPR